MSAMFEWTVSGEKNMLKTFAKFLRYTDFAEEFILRESAEPFFLFFSFQHVHFPQFSINPRPPSLWPQSWYESWTQFEFHYHFHYSHLFQFSSLDFRNSSLRGAFGDSISEVHMHFSQIKTRCFKNAQAPLTLFSWVKMKKLWILLV